MKKKKNAKLVSLSVVIVTIVLVAMQTFSVLAGGTPPGPHNFHGTLKKDGVDASIGTGVKGYIDGVDKTCSPYDTTETGLYGKESGLSGKFTICGQFEDVGATIDFYVETSPGVYTVADQTSVLVSGGNTNLDLTFSGTCVPIGTDDNCDGVDDDCDGTADDEYVGVPTQCGVGACESTGATSCVAGSVVDSCTEGTPAADDATCDGVDDDCDGTDDEDYVSDESCFLPGACAAGNAGSTCVGGSETLCQTGTPVDEDCDNGEDDDCDGATDGDDSDCQVCTDQDTQDCALQSGVCLGSFQTCTGGFWPGCVYSGIPDYEDPETSCDDLDNDCDGLVDEGLKTTYYQDSDSDGYGNLAVSQEACAQPQGYVESSTDCDDGNAAINPGATEVCTGGVDNDCDGNIDCADLDCSQNPICLPESNCDDEIDNDGDGDVDCDDSDCAQDQACQPQYCLEITSMRLLDWNGDVITQVPAGTAYQIEVTTANTCEDVAPLQIIQILDPSTTPIEIGTASGVTIPSGGSFTYTLGWVMDSGAATGTYTAEAYNWQDWASNGGSPLSADDSITFPVV